MQTNASLYVFIVIITAIIAGIVTAFAVPLGLSLPSWGYGAVALIACTLIAGFSSVLYRIHSSGSDVP